MSDTTTDGSPTVGPRGRWRGPVVVAGALIVLGLAAYALAGRPATGSEDAASSDADSIDLPSLPTHVAVDATGTAWALTTDSDGVVLSALGRDGVVASVDLGSIDAEGRFGSSLVAFEDGVAVAQVVCADEDCTDGDLAVDVAVLDDGKPVVERRWATSTGGIDAAPRVVAVDDGSLIVAAGSLFRLEGAGEVEELRFEANQGEPCLVGGRLLAVAPQTLPPEAFLEGEEHVLLVVLDEGGYRVGVEGSEVSYDRGAGYGTRCGSSGPEIARAGQPALQRWDDAAGRWTEPAEPTELAWRFPVRDATSEGLVGVLDDAIVRLDSSTGEVLGSVPIPPELFDGVATALGGRVAIGAAGTRAITCADVGDGDQAAGEESSARCQVLDR